MFGMKNVLVQYKGGGYSGCIWEWNYFLIDGQGEFVNIESSGCMGIETAEQAMELLSRENEHTRPEYYTYDLTDEKDIDEFSKEAAPPHVFGVLQWFTANPQPGITFYARCSECGQKTNECGLEGWHGCGGIASTADKLLCTDCLVGGTCDCCEEYVGEEAIIALYQVEPESDLARRSKHTMEAVRALIDDGFHFVCEWCFDNAVDKIDSDKREDIRWASFATGKPDLFDDTMRWFHDAE